MQTGASNNQLKYSNSKFDDLVKQAQFELNNEKRFQLYAQANKVLLDDAAVAPLYQRVRNAVVAPKVKNLTPSPQDSAFAGDLFIEKVEIAKE
jgi:ABC-type transport system substrate-binding protein